MEKNKNKIKLSSEGIARLKEHNQVWIDDSSPIALAKTPSEEDFSGLFKLRVRNISSINSNT